ncbi:MAG: HAMP domain-containing sensor histidine kinase [Rubripirellula sp.]|nr:HAMP domain-containing sensor histidine kinase [Rubripirellula sp.]
MPTPADFRSLRIRLLVPLLGVAVLASVAVAVGSYWIGDRWARQQASDRYAAIESTIAPATFLLTQPVLRSVSALTKTELLAVNAQGVVIQSSIDAIETTIPKAIAEPSQQLQTISIANRDYQYRTFSRRNRPEEEDLRIAVLFDENELRATRWTAATLPLVTGLSTIILLTSVTLLLTSRLLRRLARLQSQVDQIAEGNFDLQVHSDTSDEIGLLSRAVTQMGSQLQTMWNTLNRQQGQKLLHQVAGGLAHQLRNSITGARMAVELHQQQCSADDKSLSVALSQLEQTESHIRRLLLVASGKRERDQPQTVTRCLDDIRGTIDGTARHLRVDLRWEVSDHLDNCQVSDGPTLHAAVTNLAINALEEASRVEIKVRRDPGDRLKFEVIDNGSGPPEGVTNDLFEPFVTSKPEGLGLGLPLVASAAQRLGGEVDWRRQSGQTWFTLAIPVSVDTESSERQAPA